jgi:nucleoside-diphosphate-sugar epimerase
LIEAASKHDIVIHTASGFHTEAAKALVTGLGQRKAATGNDVYYFHTTGTSNIGDKPITKEYHEARILSDKDDLYSYLKGREEREVYAQRTTDLAAIETGIKHDVKTYLIMSPLIYGLGSGLFNRHSVQIPNILRSAIRRGHVEVVGAGEGAWDQVHIGDLASLYELLLAKVLDGDKVPYGKAGIFFSETGDFTWRQLAEGLASELFLQGVIEPDQVRQLSLEKGAQVFSGGNVQRAELGFASNSRSRAELSRELGWRPTRGRVDFKKSFAQEVKRIASATKRN